MTGTGGEHPPFPSSAPTVPRSRLAAAALLLVLGAPQLAAARTVLQEPARPFEPAAAIDPVAARLDALAPRLMAAADVPGLSIALVRRGAVVWHRGYGVSNAETREPVRDGTVYEAASLSKPLFAYAVLALVDAGALDLDAPLASYLAPPMADDPRARRITARHVLTHSSGLANWTPAGEPTSLGFAPGDRFSYSGEGFLYLQRVVERITGEPLDAFMRRTVFEPLGMRSTSYDWLPEYGATKSFTHDLIGDLTGRRRPAEANAAGSLQTTAEDYGRFVAAMVAARGPATGTARAMLRRQIAVDSRCRECLDTTAVLESRTLGWGLGWGLEREGGRDWFWHWGNNPGSKAFAIGGEAIGLVVLTNGENGMSIVPELLAASIGGEHPALAWIQVERYDSPPRLLFRDIARNGVGAVAAYRARRASRSALTEAEVNAIGLMLLGKGMVDEAVALLELNARDFGRSAGAHASLGVAYVQAGMGARAKRSYMRVLELAPNDSAALAALARLAGAAAQ